ncbi:hypothetical protein CDAR_19391 [Caerostris darwini]|uniref:Uncharacterized protein n=1 Tax=Caerostris darwini TaxID=1538125 RepID=A0AAV4WEI4_9ARAC|nr:hypothetical protein CDAR_19391 [Caerostris darwini]
MSILRTLRYIVASWNVSSGGFGCSKDNRRVGDNTRFVEDCFTHNLVASFPEFVASPRDRAALITGPVHVRYFLAFQCFHVFGLVSPAAFVEPLSFPKIGAFHFFSDK